MNEMDNRSVCRLNKITYIIMQWWPRKSSDISTSNKWQSTSSKRRRSCDSRPHWCWDMHGWPSPGSAQYAMGNGSGMSYGQMRSYLTRNTTISGTKLRDQWQSMRQTWRANKNSCLSHVKLLWHEGMHTMDELRFKVTSMGTNMLIYAWMKLTWADHDTDIVEYHWENSFAHEVAIRKMFSEIAKQASTMAECIEISQAKQQERKIKMYLIFVNICIDLFSEVASPFWENINNKHAS